MLVMEVGFGLVVFEEGSVAVVFSGWLVSCGSGWEGTRGEEGGHTCALPGGAIELFPGSTRVLSVDNTASFINDDDDGGSVVTRR